MANTAREKWRKAYRKARIRHKSGLPPDVTKTGIPWQAQRIVAYGRANYRDFLTTPVMNRLATKRIIDELIAEEKGN